MQPMFSQFRNTLILQITLQALSTSTLKLWVWVLSTQEKKLGKWRKIEIVLLLPRDKVILPVSRKSTFRHSCR